MTAAAVLAAARTGASPATPAPREPFAASVAAITWPEATRAFMVRPPVVYNGEWSATVTGTPGPPAGTPAPAVTFDPPGKPIATWGYTADRVRWSFEVAALPQRAPGDTGLIASIQATAVNGGPRPRRCTFRARLAPGDKSRPYTATDVGRPGSPRISSTLSYGWSDYATHGDTATRSVDVAPGSSATFRILMSSYPTSLADLEKWSAVPHAEIRARVVRDWDEMTRAATTIRVGDTLVEDAYRDALQVLIAARERRADGVVPIGSPLHYRDVWIRDGARVAYALAVSGFPELAARLSRGLLAFQWPQGFVISQRGQLDGTGEALWAVEQSTLRCSPPAATTDDARAALLAWRWYERQRDASGDPLRMQPFAEPRDNELVRAQLVGTDLWAIAGYRATARLLDATHQTRAADSVRASLRAYRDDVQRALEARSFPDIPASWQGCGRDWGNVSAGFPCDAVPVGAPRLARLARRLWSSAGGVGLCTYGNADTLHYYLGADLGVSALLANYSAADSVFAAMLRWRTASGGAPELFSRRTRSFGDNLPPHTTSAAALVTYLRTALVSDWGDTLRLTLGARPAWWKHGEVRGAPTWWGRVDVAFQRSGDAASWTWTPVPVWTALRLPPRTTLAAPPLAPLQAASDGRVVLAPPGSSTAAVQVRDDAN